MHLFTILLVIFLTSSTVAQAQFTKPQLPASKKESASFSRKTALPKWSQSLAEIPLTQSKEPVVIRLNETQAWAGTSPSVLINRAIQVNDQNALGSIGQFGINYFPSYQQLNLHKVAILRGGEVIDRTATVNTRLLQRETSIEIGMLGGATTVQLLLEDVRVGDTLWVIYSIEGENPVFGKRWTSDFYWDGGSLTEHRRLTVLHPRNRPLIWRQLGDYIKDEIKPQIDVVGDIERIRFEGKAIEALDNEPSIPKNYMPVRILQFSEYNNWQEVAVWADSLFPKVSKSAELKRLAQNFSAKPDAMAQASAALQWVQNEVRYFSVSIGENSHRPQTPETVLKRRYGDCKDKSYLLVSLLAQLDIQAHPVLISAQAPKSPAKMQASPAVFDHVIVQLKIADKTYYVDPTRTNQTAMIDQLTPAFPEAAGLIVDAATKDLLTLPARSETMVHYEHREEMKILNFAGEAILETREVYRGNYAEWARQKFQSYTKSEFRKAMLGIYEKLYSEISLDKDPSFQDYPEDNRFEIKVRYKLLNAVTQKDGRYSVDYDTQIVYDTLGIPEKIIRNYPFELPVNRFHGRHYFNLTWPETVREYELPSAKQLDNPYFRIHEELAVAGNSFNFVSDYQVKVKEVRAKEMSAFQKQAKELVKFTKGNFQVFERRLSKPGFNPFTIRELEAIRTFGDMEVAVEKIRKKQSENLSVTEYCDMLLSSIPVAEMAKKSIQRAAVDVEGWLVSDEKIKGIKLCQAKLYFATGKYDKSLKLFDAEGALSGTSNALREFAWANFYEAKIDTSVDLINRYFLAKSASDDQTISALDLLYVVALYQRAGKPLPAGVLAAATEMQDGPWPRPLLAYQLGKISEAEIVAYVNQFSDDIAQLYANEMWFFIGQKHLSEGRQSEAKNAFSWIRNKGTRNPSTYMQALAELNRLQADEKFYLAGIDALNHGKLNIAFENFSRSSQLGFAKANTELGRAYYGGYRDVVSKDYKRALDFFTIAAKGGDAEAMNFIGSMYSNQEGLKQDQKLAFEWYLNAAEKDDKHALYNLAKYYFHGNLINMDVAKAVNYYELSALQDHKEAQLALSRLYFEGTKINPDYAQAYRWAFLAAFHDNSDAMVILGRLYLTGKGVTRDGKAALSWLELAERHKNIDAAYFIAQIYLEGIDVPVDKKKAAEWMKKAADNGNKDAKTALGSM